MNEHSGWIGCDLDGTLAKYPNPYGHNLIGRPVPLMLQRVQRWLAEGRQVKIVTARVASSLPMEEVVRARKMITSWLELNLGQALPIVSEKDYSMVELWDDRAVQVITNTGERADGAKEGA